MRTLMTWLGGASLGAGAMYLMDPDRGGRRRADLRQTLAEVADSDLVQRAQSEVGVLGRLGGSTEMLERSAWLSALSGLTGRRRRGTLTAGDWTMLGGVLGAVVAGLWLARRAGNGAGIEIARTVRVEAPVERVYELWSDLENLPRFMSHVREVKRVGPDRTHWVVAGPAGAPIEWDAIVTERMANAVIAWRTVEGAVVEHRGAVRFRPLGAGATMLEVRLTYRPVGGTLGHGLATMLGSDPERVIGEDLDRVAAQLRTPRPAAGELGQWR